MYNPFSLSGKTILVTGASSGIGQATAIECSKLGAKLVITGRNAERLQETMNQLEGEGHQQIIAELTDAEQLTQLVEGCPNLQGVALCAGRPMTLPFQFCTREKMDDVFSTNYFAPFELLRLLAKKKKISAGSSAVFITSIGGVLRCTPGNTVYGATKAALTSTMKFAALELAQKKIRVNAVCPGMTNTKLIHAGTISEEQLKANEAKVPLGKFCDPIDIAQGVVYMLSDASKSVTGHSLVIDGGVTI